MIISGIPLSEENEHQKIIGLNLSR